MQIKQVSPYDVQVSAFIDQLDRYQSSLYPAESNHLDSRDTLADKNCMLLGAYDNEGNLLGIGAAKIVGEFGELKRFYVADAARGKGVAEKILKELEVWLRRNGIERSCLETGIHQPAALKFYERLGYEVCGPFGEYKPDPLSVFMSKELV